MPCRLCACCNRLLDKQSYSRNQWSKPIGISRCHSCVANGGRGSSNSGTNNYPNNHTDRQRALQSARCNNANRATFNTYDLQNPFAEGGFRWVAKGRYTEGQRSGEKCVCKWFKSGVVFENTFFDLDIKAMDKALDLIKEWNSRHFINHIVKLNVPEVWTFDSDSSTMADSKVLQEPYIDNYQKFNSNTGWTDDSTPWPRVMQALSHFSYHVSSGQFVLCDLQGGIYSDGIVLTDPVILSRSKSFGVTDLGPRGISTFFSNHRCNEFCRSNWMKPNDQRQYYAHQAGTSMMR